MKKTRICDLLGIDYPIIQGGMTWIATAELAAAVSEAGGLGVISPTANATLDAELPENLRNQIRKAKSLTRKPFGVNIPLGMESAGDCCLVLIEEEVRVAVTSAGNPRTYTGYLKDAGVKVLHVIASVRHAKTAENAGVDAVVAEGYEAGGHNGLDELPTMVLVPQVVDAVKIPVVAGGGFVDAQGLVAALALGAEGILMGTRFIATKECPAHPKFKEWLLSARETDTIITQRSIRSPARNLKNELVLKVLEMESHGATLEELLPITSGENTRRVYLEGDLSGGLADCGQVVGLIHDIPTVKEVIDGIIRGAEEIIKEKLPALVANP